MGVHANRGDFEASAIANWRAARERLMGGKQRAVVRRELVPVIPKSGKRIRRIYFTGNVLPPEHGLTVAQRIHLVIRAVAEKHGETPRDIIGHRRSRPLVLARHEAIWRVKKKTGLSNVRIGEFFGGRDPTSILHAVRQHEKRSEAGE